MEPQILDNLDEGVLVIDAKWRIVAFNSAAERLTGHSRQQAVGQYCYELLRTTRCGDDCPVRVAMQTGVSQRNVLVQAQHRRGDRTWLCVSASPYRNEQGEIVGGLEILRVASCIHDSCCEADVEAEGAGSCSHAQRAVELRHAESAHARPSHRAILRAEVRPEEAAARTAEAEKLSSVLQAHGWNRQRTADALGISRSTLWRRMKEFGLID